MSTGERPIGAAKRQTVRYRGLVPPPPPSPPSLFRSTNFPHNLGHTPPPLPAHKFFELTKMEYLEEPFLVLELLGPRPPPPPTQTPAPSTGPPAPPPAQRALLLCTSDAVEPTAHFTVPWQRGWRSGSKALCSRWESMMPGRGTPERKAPSGAQGAVQHTPLLVPLLAFYGCLQNDSEGPCSRAWQVGPGGSRANWG